MQSYDALLQEHNRLLGMQKEPPPDYADLIHTFISDVKISGQQIGVSTQRDQLRSFLRFWSTVLYELDPSSGYQIADLDEFLGKLPAPRPNPGLYLWIAGVLILLSIGLVVTNSITAFFSASPAELTKQALTAADQTITAMPESPTLSLPSATITPAVADQATLTNTPVAPTAEPIATPSETPIPPIFSLAIISPQNGDQVSPELAVMVAYKNLPANWSIQVFVQSISSGNRIYTLPESFMIPEGQNSGEWAFTYDLSRLFPRMETDDTYIITLGLANSTALRETLIKSGVNGLAELPKEVLWQKNQPVTVNRKAYRAIDEIRLFSSNWNLRGKQSDLFASLLDGSDPIQLTNTTDLSEVYPSVSPDGRLIAFSGRRIGIDGKRLYSVWMMTSDSQRIVNLLENHEQQAFKPAWSPDNKHLAVGVEYTGAGGAGVESIFVFPDVQANLNQPAIIQSEISAPKYIEVKGEGDLRSPTWVSDHEFLFSASNLDGGALSVITKYDLLTGKTEPIHNVKGAIIEFLPKSDGKYILIYSVGSNRVIYLYDPQTTERTALVDDPASNTWLAWLPDERSLLFSSNRNQGNFSIWSIDLATGRQREIIPPLSYQPDVGLLKAYLPID